VKDFLTHLVGLVEIGAAMGVLERAHRSCDRHIDLADFRQEALLRAIQHLDSFRGETTPELVSWLQAIGWQVAAQLRRAAHPTLGQEFLRDVADRVRASADEEAAEEARLAADARWLTESLAALDAVDRSLLQRHYLGGESLVAIAQQLGLSPNTVSHRLGRLLRKLHTHHQAQAGGGAEKDNNEFLSYFGTGAFYSSRGNDAGEFCVTNFWEGKDATNVLDMRRRYSDGPAGMRPSTRRRGHFAGQLHGHAESKAGQFRRGLQPRRSPDGLLLH
jgi:RNA polymerase sigma factor (sigma-70 family)